MGMQGEKKNASDGKANAKGKDQFAREEVESSFGYLSGYEKPKSLADQVTTLRAFFPEGSLDCPTERKAISPSRAGKESLRPTMRRSRSCSTC
jgi:hypothetical protein